MEHQEFFTYLDELKSKAQSVNADFPDSLKPANGIPEWQFQMMPNGSRG